MNRMRRPFWLPASNYYVLAVAIALAFFFVVWGVLDDLDGMRAPWQTAGVSASVLLIGAVILREMILRRTQAYLRQPVPVRVDDRHKLTVERASAILGEIYRKSEAANVLASVASGHREVFEMCAAFLQRIDSELATVQAGSPRLAALLKSRNKASGLHKLHTLRWAEVEAGASARNARNLPAASERMRCALEALATVEQALASYPAEVTLLESRAVLNELALSVQVANTVEAAEQAASAGDVIQALGLYQNALMQLGPIYEQSPERERAAMRIREAIDRLPFSSENP